MKTTLGKKIFFMFFVPFLIIFGILSVLIFTMISRSMDNWIQIEIKGIAEINAKDLSSQIDNVRMSVLSSAALLETIEYEAERGRARADNVVRAMLRNDAIYNSWLTYEPHIFDGRDAEFGADYPGAPSGRFMRSYVMAGGEFLVAPDMDEEWIDDPEAAPWYTIPRDTGRVYIDMDIDFSSLWDYGIGNEAAYTLSIVSPIFRDGRVIGCVGADVTFDAMTVSLNNEYDTTVAVFYPNGHVFYSPDAKYTGESIETLGFANVPLIREAFEAGAPLRLSDEYCVFNDYQAITYFQPVAVGDYDGKGLFLYVAAPRSVLVERLFPFFLMTTAAVVMVMVVILILLLYVVRRISKPLSQLTVAANAISKGDIETEIGYFSDDGGDDIGVLSKALHRMVGQFRVHAMNMEQAHQKTTRKLQIESFITASSDMRKTFEGLTAMLCEYADVYKTTIVYSKAGKPAAFYCFNPALSPQTAGAGAGHGDFTHHEQVTALLDGRKLAFLNAQAIAAQKSAFLDPQTQSACLIPLKKETLFGYLIFENSAKVTMSEGAESIMTYTAEILSEWLSEKDFLPPQEAEPQKEPPAPREEEPFMTPMGEVSTIALLKRIEELEVDAALADMGGLHDVYEQTIKLTARLLPETIRKMDQYMEEGDGKAFTIEAHALKSVLRNVGAPALGIIAARLEKAGQDGETAYCREHYPPFRDSIAAFAERVKAAIVIENAVKGPMDRETLSAALKTARSAAEGFDTAKALDAVGPLARLTYSEEADGLLEKVIFALEEFNCGEALAHIKNLEGILNGQDEQ